MKGNRRGWMLGIASASVGTVCLGYVLVSHWLPDRADKRTQSQRFPDTTGGNERAAREVPGDGMITSGPRNSKPQHNHEERLSTVAPQEKTRVQLLLKRARFARELGNSGGPEAAATLERMLREEDDYVKQLRRIP